MPVELVVPSVGESVTEVEIGDWLKNPGELIHQDEPVVVIETEKVTVELPAPTSGTLTTTLKRKGEKASVGDVIGYMEPDGALTVGAVYDRPEPGGHRPPLQKTNKTTESPETILETPSRPSANREEQVVPMTPIRRRIAERLVEAQKTAALLTTFNQ